MKIASLLLPLFNSVVAGLIIIFSLSSADIQQSGPLWTLLKVSTSLLVIVISALTWFPGLRRVDSGLRFLSGLLLIVIGTAAMIWTIHLAIVTGDMESYMLVYGGSLILQAALSLWDQRQHSDRLSVS